MQPRLTALKTPPIEALIYRVLVRPALRRAFQRVALWDAQPEFKPDLPTLIYANHPSWWDGYIAFMLAREYWRCDGYLMMEEAQLARYGFFRYCGVFSVDRHDPREGMRSVAYAANLLTGHPRRALWIFPQGAITANDRRPLDTYSGAAHIARRAMPVRCLPMALRFEFLAEQRPEALIRLGPGHVVAGDVGVKALHQEMDQRLTREVDHLRDDTINGATGGYRTILQGRASVNVIWDRVRATIRPTRRPPK
jgi:1-acyl-sn-glycerol-3-phosphate acyltransferase